MSSENTEPKASHSDGGALETALAALAQDPHSPEALAQLSASASNGHGASEEARRTIENALRHHRERGDFDVVVRLLDLEIAAASDDEKKADLLFEQARIFADELLREADAVRGFERVLELRPGDETAEDALGHISLVRDNWQKILHKYLEEAKSSTDRQLTASLYLSVAELHSKYQPDESVERYLKKALEVDPRNLKASHRLERLYRQASYRDAPRWPDLAQLLEQRAEAAVSREDRVLAYLSLAELERTHRARPTEAAEAYKKVLGIDPTNARALTAIVGHYTETQDWQPLIRVYENALRAKPRGEPELGMLLQIAMIWWKKLENLDAADEYWKRIRKVDPAHPVMLEFYRAYHGGDSAKLLPILQQAQRLSSGDKKGLDLALETARAAEQSKGAAERAIDLWKGVLRLEAGHPEALVALERLYERTEKWNALLELHKDAIEGLNREAVAAGSGSSDALIDQKVARLLQIVRVYRDRLALDTMALSTYQQILQLRPDHEEALTSLAQRYEAMGRWNDLIAILQRRADVRTDAGEKAALLRRVADLWIEKFGNLNQAVRPLEELSNLEPENAEVLARLRDLYTRRRAWRSLVDLERKEEQRLASRGTAAERRAKLVEIAKLTADRLGEIKEAIAVWNRLLELDEHDPEALSALAALYEREKRWPALVEILRRQALAVPAPGSEGAKQERSRVALLERAANLLAERLSQPERAAEIYREILSLQPGHPRAMRTLQGMFAQEGRLDELVALYAKSGQYEELYEVLQQTAERLTGTEGARRIEVLARAADVAHNHLRNQDKAARAYERILALDASQGEATRTAALALLPIYRASEKWARLLATYEVLLGFATTPDDKLALLREIRDLCEEKLGSRGLAFSWAARAYALRPDDAAMERELERLAAAAETWDELAEIYEKEVAPGPAALPAERRLARLRRLADISLNHQHKLDDARKYYEQILELEPGDSDALAALEQLFAEGKSFPQLLAVYRQRDSRWRGAASEPAHVDLLFKIAWIEEEKIADLDAARKTLGRIAELEPGAATELRALRALERIEAAGGAGRLASLAQILERQLVLAEHDDTYIELASRLAELYADKLARPADALAHLQGALKRDPNRRATHAALEKLVESGKLASEAQLAALRLLVPSFEERLRAANGDEAERTAARIVDFLDRELSMTTGAAARDALLVRLTQLADDLATSPALVAKRYGWAAERFERDVGSRELRRAFVTLGLAADRGDDVAVRLTQAETGADGEATRRELAMEVGALFENPLGMVDEALAAYRRVLAMAPEDEKAEGAVERLLKEAERYAELRALYVVRKTRALDPQRRVDVLLAICDLDEGVLDDNDAAIASYEELLELDPQSTRAFRALERLYVTAERFAELEALIAAREPFALTAQEHPEVRGTPESRAHLRFRRGELYREKLGDLQRAVDLYEEALGEEPTHEGSRRALEGLLRKPEARLRVARVLQPIYETDQAWPKLALVLGAERESLEGADAVPLLMRLAALQEEKLGARQLALSTWREALRIDPRDERARSAVERLAILLGRHADLAAAWDEAYLASDPTDLPLRADLLARSARLYERELRDMQKAEAAWRRLFELDPGNPELGRPAAEALERIYESQEAWPRLVEVLRRQVDWSDGTDARRQLLFRIARIQEELIVDPKAATVSYRELLDADPSDRGALDGLEKLHAAKSEWPALVDVLRRRLELETEARARRELLFRLAQLTERELGDPAGAVPAYGALLDEVPDDVAALEALMRLHEAAGRKVDLLEILERRIFLESERMAPKDGQAKEPSGRIDPKAAPRDERNLAGLRMRAAALDLELGRQEGALERFREILERDPKHEAALRGLEQLLADPNLRFRAAELLEPRYREQGDSARLLSINELLSDASPELSERLARLDNVAQLRAAAGDKDGAFEALAKAARLAVGEPRLASLLDRLEIAAPPGARAHLVTLYRDLAPEILDATTQERVNLTVAAESDRLGDRDTARDYYRRVLDSAPDNLRALGALEAIYADAQDWNALYEIYARRAELASQSAIGDSDVRRRYLLLGAKLCEAQLDRPADAIPAYEEALTLQPADAETSRALESRYEAASRWHELADLLERRLGFADELDEAVALRVRLAKLFETELSDIERAIESYRAALGGDPTHAEAIKALERYLEDPVHGPTVAEVLEPVYVARHDWPRLVRVCELRLEAADDPRARLGLRRRIARIYEEQLEDLDGAFTAYTRVFQEDPLDRGTRDQLARLAGVLGAWERLAQVYEQHLTDVGADGAGSEEALRALASIYHERLADVDRARGAYGRLLERDREDEIAFFNLEKLLERASRWAELLDVYREAAQNTLDLEVRRRLLHKAASVAEQRIDDLDVAIQLQRSLLDIDPADSVALAALDRLYLRGERWHDLAELIERRIADRDESDLEGWVGDKLRLAGLRAGALEDKSGALDLYEEILGRRPGEPRVVRELEGVIVEPEHTYRIAQLLGPIYRAEDSWQKLIVIHEAELEFIEDQAERVARLMELATLHEKRGNDRRRAFQSLLRAWREESDAAGGREADLFADLCRLAESEKLFGELVEALEKEAAGSEDLELRARVYRRVAELAEAHLSDRARAIEALGKVIDAVETDEAAWDASERLLAAEGRSRDLVRSLERRATVTTDPEQRKSLHQRAAVVYEEALREADAAIGAWRLVLEVDADDQAALAALARLHRARNEHGELADVLDRQIGSATEQGKRRALRAELGALASGALADLPRAIDAWRSVLADDARDREALVELRRIEGQSGHAIEELEALDALVELTEPGPSREALRLEAAELVEHKLKDPETAIGRYAGLLEAAGGKSGPARGALERLAREQDTRAQAAQVLEPAYERVGEWASLIELGELVLAGETDPGERRAWLLKMASAAERGLSDGKTAFTLWARMLHEEPSDEDARKALERLAEAEAIPGELARVYEELLAASPDPEVSRTIALRLGEIFEQKIGDEERAIVAYSQALEAAAPAGDDEGERGALRALDRLLSRAGRPRDLAEVLQKQAAASDATLDRVGFLHRLGVLLAGELVDLDGALSAFSDALELDPAHVPSRTGLEALLDSEPHREAALDVLEPIAERDADAVRQNALAERRLLTLRDDAERGALLERIAEREENALGDPALAFGAIARALVLDPASERLAEEAERLAGVRKRVDEAASLFERVAAGDVAPDVRRSLGLRAGRLWESAGAPDKAEARYLAILTVERDDADALEALERIYRVRNDAGRLADVLTRRASVELDSHAKKALLAEAARLAESALGDADGAVELWRQVRAIDDLDADALAALSRILEARGRWAELADLLAEAATTAPDAPTQAALLGRIAAISSERLQDLPRAIAALRELLDLEPEAMAALDSLIDLEAKRGDDLALKEALERKLGALASGPARIPVFRRLAEVATRREDIDDALGYLHEIVAIDENDAAAQTAQIALLERTERWNDLVDVLGAEAKRRAAVGDTAGELASLVRAADLWEGKLDSPESATELLERILERDPGNVRALLSLSRIAEASGDSERARTMLAAAEAAAKTPAELAELAFRRGRVEAEAGDETAAIGHYRRAIAADPTHAGSVAALVEHARNVGDHAGLAQLLEGQLAASKDDGRATRIELARLYLDKLAAQAQSSERARTHLEALRAATPDDAQVTELLADLHFGAGRLDEARPLYTALIQAAVQAKKRGKELARLHTRVGEIAEKKGDLDAALASFADAQRLDAGHAPTLVALGRIQIQKGEWEAARKLYRSLLLQNLEADAGITKSGVYQALGEIHEKLNEGPKAIGMYERGLEFDPTNEALKAALARLRVG